MSIKFFGLVVLLAVTLTAGNAEWKTCVKNCVETCQDKNMDYLSEVGCWRDCESNCRLLFPR